MYKYTCLDCGKEYTSEYDFGTILHRFIATALLDITPETVKCKGLMEKVKIEEEKID